VKLVALASVLVFVGLAGTIGTRLLLLARRTGGRPELALGLGLASLAFVTFPTTVLSVAVGFGWPALEKALFAVGLVPVGFFAASLFAFTREVFRPGSARARAVVWAAALGAACLVAGLGWARISQWQTGPVADTRPWLLGLVTLFAVGLTWTAVESGRYWWSMRRRVGFGLADPVVANRFFLWALASCLAVVCLAVVGGSKAAGLVIVQHPLPRLAVGLAGTGLVVCWTLAFLPPEAYLRRLRGHRPAPAPAR